MHELACVYEMLHNAVRDFPKLERYSLGVSIEKIILDCLHSCFLATALPASAQKLNAVATASAHFDALKLFVRLALQSKCLDEKIYLKLLPHFGSIGSMMGGWLKGSNKLTTANPIPNPNLPPPYSKSNS